MLTARSAILLGVAALLVSGLPAAAFGGEPESDFAAAHRIAERETPPEPLSPWVMLDGEIERLVARGELPFEAWTFRPVDRGELAAWLASKRSRQAAGQRHSASVRPGAGSAAVRAARRRIKQALAWERTRWLGPQPGECPPPMRPGALLRIGDADRMLFLLPYLRVMPALERGDEVCWTDSSRIGVRGVLSFGSALNICTELFAAEVGDARRFADPLIAGTDFILHAEELTLSARTGAFRWRAGRDRHRWGPGISGTLLLGDRSEPFNFIEYQFRLADKIRFLALTGVTNLHAEPGSPGANPSRRRYLSAHRLLWNISPDFCIGLSEGARYQSDAPHWLYLSGIAPYTLVERFDYQDEPADSTDDYLRNNVLWSLDASWRVQPGWVVYAEVLMDDIGAEDDETPTRGGLQVGATYVPRWRGWDWTLGVEFTKVSNYTYSVFYQDFCQCDWEHQGESLGYPWGPDVENLLLRWAIDPAPKWGGSGWMEVTRKGRGAIGKPWKPEDAGCCPGCDDDCGAVAAWELSGPVGRTLALGVSARYRPHGLCWTGASFEWRRLSSSAGASGDDPETETTLRFFLSLGG